MVVFFVCNFIYILGLHQILTESPTFSFINCFVLWFCHSSATLFCSCLSFYFLSLCNVLVYFKFVLFGFIEMSENYSFSQCLILSKRLMEVITKLDTFSTLQMACKHVVESAMSNTTYCRYEQTLTNIFFEDRWH